MTPEGKIKAEISDYLRARGIFFWTNQAGKVPGRRLARTGISDLLGIYKGKFLAIEVKSEKGKATDEQLRFLCDVVEEGGIGFVAYSIEDVEAALI